MGTLGGKGLIKGATIDPRTWRIKILEIMMDERQLKTALN